MRRVIVLGSFALSLYMVLPVACQATAIDLEIRFHSSPHQQQGHFMVSSLLPTVCLQSSEGIPLRTAWFLHCCMPSASADSVHVFGS